MARAMVVAALAAVACGRHPAAKGNTAVVNGGAAGWTFYDSRANVPAQVMGVSADEGGNLWVAGGKEGVFVLRKGAAQFEQFTLKDGLHPYGYLSDGSPSDTDPYLEAISISGGPSGTAFVGYKGKPPPAGHLACEDNWDGEAQPDPAIYKSGDADRVTLAGSGISVVHYDIFSGPGVVAAETRGREKLCNVVRILYDGATGSVWFGGNHGFAWGDAAYAGDPRCDGQLRCSGVQEHAHPAINGYASDTSSTMVFLTADYYGIAIDPVSRDLWFGGMIRTTRFRVVTRGSFEAARVETEESADDGTNRLDVWPDKTTYEPRPKDRVDDLVSGIAALGDGTVWISSFLHGLAHVRGSDGKVLDYVNAPDLMSDNVGALAAGPDGSVWAGHSWGGGLDRVMPDGSIEKVSYGALGDIANSGISDVQVRGSDVLVAFQQGAVGVYSGK